MTKIINTRKWFSKLSTIGELRTEDNSFICYILEPPDFGLSNDLTLPAILLEKEKVWNDEKKYVAIAPGEYPLIMMEAPHLIERFPELEKEGIKEFPELTGIKGSQGVFIHPGNFPKDTEECQLPGMTRGIDEVGSSTGAWNVINTKLGEQIKTNQVIYVVQRDQAAWEAFQQQSKAPIA